MKKGDKRGQFYLIAAIIIAGILIGISYIINYSTKSVSYEAEESANELRIEAERVMDYEMNNPLTALNELEDFAMEYSYHESGKEIYFIVYDPATSLREAYSYSENNKVDYTGDLEIGDTEIYFNNDNKVYTFPLEKGKNFYFLIIYDSGGERYVYAG